MKKEVRSTVKAAQKALPSFVMIFDVEKETPGTLRFQEKTDPGKPPVLRTLYMQKWAAGDAKKLRVTIDVLA